MATQDFLIWLQDKYMPVFTAVIMWMYTGVFLTKLQFLKKGADVWDRTVCAHARESPFQILNRLTDFQEIWYGHYAIGGHVHTCTFQFPAVTDDNIVHIDMLSGSDSSATSEILHDIRCLINRQLLFR